MSLSGVMSEDFRAQSMEYGSDPSPSGGMVSSMEEHESNGGRKEGREEGVVAGMEELQRSIFPQDSVEGAKSVFWDHHFEVNISQESVRCSAFTIHIHKHNRKKQIKTIRRTERNMSLAPSIAMVASSSSSLQPQATDHNSNLSHYLPLYKAALRGGRIATTLHITGDGYTTRITENEDTVLHIAVGTGKSNDSVQKLVNLMSNSQLKKTNKDGDTELSIAAMVGNIEAARMLLQRAPDLVKIANNDGRIPLLEAARYGQKDMVLCLLEFPLEEPSVAMTPRVADKPGAFLLDLLIIAGFHDVAIDLIKHDLDYTILRQFSGESVLSTMIEQPSSFPSGSHLKFWQRIIYNNCDLEMSIKFENEPNHGDIENPSDNQPSVPFSNIPIHQVRIQWFLHFRTWFLAIISRIFAAKPLKCIRDTKLRHHQTLELVKHICTVFAGQNYSIASSLFKQPLLLAAKSGIHEVIEEIVESFPAAIWFSDEENHNIFHLAVMNRRVKVFNLMYQMTDYKHLVTVPKDTSGNNILHLAGKLAPAHQLNQESGAALQMQRELQWFKEVEKFVQPAYRDDKNSRGKTPAMVFTEEHKDLVKEGEKWMKETANSCIFVAALMATVGFTIAITTPSADNLDFSTQVFERARAVVIFSALSLFSSTASVLMFLSILTSRYAEDDFMYALPKRLIVGLVTLFLSIIFMMIAFGTTLYLVFGRSRQWILNSVAVLACVPVTLFGSLQFPLLVEMIMSTYSPSIFHKQSNRILY